MKNQLVQSLTTPYLSPETQNVLDDMPQIRKSAESTTDMSRARTFVKLWETAALDLLGDKRTELNLNLEDRNELPANATAARRLAGGRYEMLDAYAQRVSGILNEEFSTVRERLIFRFVQLLNQQEWTTISRTLQTPQGMLTSVLQPLNEAFGQAQKVAHFVDYEKSGKSSGTIRLNTDELSTSTRLLNAWHTSLFDASGRELFTGFRTGTLGAYGLTDPVARDEASKGMARELLLAIVAHRINALGLKDTERVMDEGETLVIPLVSLELQSNTQATMPRLEYVAIGSGELELDTLAAQLGKKALQSLAGHHTLDIEFLNAKGERRVFPVRVEVQTMHFNFPVHHDTLRDGDGFGRSVLEQNAQAFEKLLPLVFDRLQRARAHQANPEFIHRLEHTLVETVEIYATGAYAHPGYDPYKMNSRIANLAYLAGADVHFNCRSGKDRTSMLDSEIKAYAATTGYAVTRAIPELLPTYKRPPTREEQELIAQLAITSGNTEIQTLNTGVPGYKLKPMTLEVRADDALVQRVGIQNWEEFRGLSGASST